MLRRLDLTDQWRSLDKGFWPDDFPLGRRTVVYGHNGSGKSTLAELLLRLAEGSSPTSVVWEHEDSQRTNVSTGSGSPAASVAVFTRRWVDSNLSAFLDGANASAIVTLGREAIDAKEEEARLATELEHLQKAANEASKQHKTVCGDAEKLAREVQGRIVAELQTSDYAHFTKHRYSISKVQADLRKYEGAFPDSKAHAEALNRLREGAPGLVAEIPAPKAEAAAELIGLSDILAETPTRVAISALEGNPVAQGWVEQGVPLHADLGHCLFCAGEILGQRRAELARHFDESWLQIRGKARDMLARVTAEKEALVDWRSGLPNALHLSGELQPVYADAVDRAQVEVDERVAALEAVESVLKTKVADPSATPQAPNWSVLSTPPSIAVLRQAVSDHNDQARGYEGVTSQRKQTVLDHIVGSQSAAFKALESQANEWDEKSIARSKEAELAERRLDEVRQARFTTKDMADTLTRDLARVYGKDHLSVAVTADGKSYACRRGDKPGTDLSHGERTTLSLLYFLRKLEDEQVPGGDPSERIVVIDDPSSSLDREALFATHQWLIDSLKVFGQYIVFTHDFSLLRLFIKSHKKAWGASTKKIKNGDADERRFPKVSFLEMYAVAVNGTRRSKVGRLPHLLLTNTSEYAYLFSMVMKGIADSEEHERLFLLPNAARRVLEVFASYKAPHRTDFLQQLEILVQAQDGEPFRDVYDFCNRFSHGEGSESTDVLDARAIHQQIRRCMQFLQAVDSEHFERMCAATDIDPATLT